MLFLAVIGGGLALSTASTGRASATVTTDKPDYAPSETVVITGAGFGPGDVLDVVVTRPDGSIVIGDGSFTEGWDTVTTIWDGSFTYNYILNGVLGTYHVDVYASPWNGPDSFDLPLAATTFTDFTAVSVSINAAAYSTNNLTVTLTVSWSGSGGDPTQARFANDLSPEGNCSNLGGGVFGPWTTLTEIGTTNTATFTHVMVADNATTANTALRRVCSEVAQGPLNSPTNTLSANDTIFHRLNNPPLAQVCGVDMVLVIDSSGSIDATELAAMKTALKAFIDAYLPGTDTEVAVVEFDTAATVTQAFTSNAATAKTAVDAAISGGNTNWDDAIRDARLLFPNRAAKPDFLVFASDGNPNVRGGHTTLGHSAATANVSATDAMAWAGAEANAAKAAGARILGLGIGTDLTLNNMIAISGTDTHPPNPITASTDVISSDFSTLAADLGMLAKIQCGGKINVHKIIDADGNLGTAGDQTNGAGWTFGCVATSGAPDACDVSSQVTLASGFIPNPFAITLGGDLTANVNITESAMAGFSFVSANCTKPGPTGTPGVMTVTGIVVTPLDIVTCTFYNTPAGTDVKITSQIVTSPPGATAGQPFNIRVDKVLHNNGQASPVTVSITPVISGPPDCTIVPVGGNPTSAVLTLSVPVPVTENFTVTCTNASSHIFTINNCIAITTAGVTDSNPSNNCAAQVQPVVVIGASSDVKVTGSVLSAPATASIGVPFPVSATVTLHNNGPFGPVNVDTILTLNLPGDCTTTSANPQTVQNTSLLVSVPVNIGGSWSVTCTDPSAHSFGGTATATIDLLHVSDPLPSNGNPNFPLAVTNVFASSDVKLAVAGVVLSIQASANVGAGFPVNATANLHNNGPYGPTNVDATVTLSLPSDCSTVSPNPAVIQNVPLAVSVVAGPVVGWTVVCTSPSSHNFTASASVVIDQGHVNDPISGNNSGISAPRNINILATSDVKITTSSLTTPVTFAAGSPFPVTANVTLHNNGPDGPVNVDVDFDLLLPPDCTTPSTDPQTQENVALPVSVPTPLPAASWTVTCTNPSSHDFRVQITARIDQVHVSDSNLSNNSATPQSATAITVDADVKVTAVTVTSPPGVNVNTTFGVSATATLHNNGPDPTMANTTLTLSMAGDCSLVSSANPQVIVGTPLPVSSPVITSAASWNVTCSSPSNHDFSVSASASVNQLHVTDPVPGNNSNSGASVTNILASADVKVTGASVTAPLTATAGTPFPVSASATLHNNGTQTPVNVDTSFLLTLPSDCTTPSANPRVVQNTPLLISVATAVGPASWTVNCTSGSSHMFPVTASAAVDQVHVSDPDINNNSAMDSETTAVSAVSDIKVTTVAVGSPASFGAYAAFNVTANVSLHNNGPSGPTNVDTTITLTMPGDCSTGSTNPVLVPNTPLPVSALTALPQATWSVTCTSPSSHTFSVGAGAVVDQLHVTDPNGASGSGSSNTTIIPAKIRVCKDVIPNDSSVWDFQAAGPSPGTVDDLGDGQCADFGANMIPGTYAVSETFQVGYYASIDCGRQGDPVTGVSTSVVLPAGTTVTCTFINAFSPGPNPVGGFAGLLNQDSGIRNEGAAESSMGVMSLLTFIGSSMALTIASAWAVRRRWLR